MMQDRGVQEVGEGCFHKPSTTVGSQTTGAKVGDLGSSFCSSEASIADAAVRLWKFGSEAEIVHALSGELYATPDGWILLRVPNALVRGAFDALNETGAELPYDQSSRLNAHVSVMRPEETLDLGGVDKVTERGHHFAYTLGPVKTIEKANKSYSRVWMIGISSPELLQLRKSYGLGSPKYPFHLTIAVRKPSVLYDNSVKKS